MPCARPESIAAAKIISSLVAQQCIPSRKYAVLHHELPIPRRVAPAVAFETAAPFMRRAACLVETRRKSSCHIRACRQKSLFEIDLSSFFVGERPKRFLARNIRTDDPLDRQPLQLFGSRLRTFLRGRILRNVVVGFVFALLCERWTHDQNQTQAQPATHAQTHLAIIAHSSPVV